MATRVECGSLGTLFATAVLIAACGDSKEEGRSRGPEGGTEGRSMALVLTSPSFGEGGTIPAEFTCDGEDRSPALAWSGAPPKTASFALICDDPDAPAGNWVHWVVLNLPPESTGLPEGVPASRDLGGGGIHGKNSWGRLGYGGPCPPSGTHRYYFKLYALDTSLDLSANPTKADVVRAMEGHVLAEGQLMGRYKRR